MKKYYYIKHGLLYIVYKRDSGGLAPMSIEDSRWESEDKAKLHCEILNLES